MWLIDQIAEQRIAVAIKEGAFQDLPGAGQPLYLEDDSLVPEELRPAYRVLKNAGYLPPEIGLRSEIADVNVLLAQTCVAEERTRLNKRLNYLLMQLRLNNPDTPLAMEEFYSSKLLRK
jgi:hypothetical protein